MGLFDVLPDLDNPTPGSIEATASYIQEEVAKVAEQLLEKKAEEVPEEKQTFFFEEYFSDPKDRGIEIKIPWKGKNLPFRLRRALTLKEKQRASDAAFKLELDKNNKPKIGSQDQGAFTAEVILIGLKYWPFEYSPGKPVPINRETIGMIDSGLAEEIGARILGVTEVPEQALDPSEKKSVAA